MISDETLQKILDEIAPDHETEAERESRLRVRDVIDSLRLDSSALGRRTDRTDRP